ncbi:MAG: hypothetical protein HY040_19330, partial [Planctomycetes bacterium]|nr:hypothetical protein [Planctomycetota bacterium]
MKSFIQRFGAFLVGILCGFDRLRFRGVSRLLNNTGGVNSYLYRRDLLVKEFAQHTQELTAKIIAGTEALAKSEGLAIRYLNSPNLDKEAVALELAQERRIRQGRIAIRSCVETCRTFRVRGNRGNGHIEVRAEDGKCNHFYHYFVHERVGLCYVRVQSWFPFTMRVGLNGREWLFRQLRQAKIGFCRQDNLLVAVDDWSRAQELLDQQLHTDWPAFLNDLATQTNPLLPYLHNEAKVPYYWMTEQSEWATDMVFQSPRDLARLHPRFVRHCLEVLGCRDLLRFLGRHVPAQAFGKRYTALAVKADLKERHEGLRANERLAQSLATVADPTPLAQLLKPLGRPVLKDGRRARPLNPLVGPDAALLQILAQILARGDFLLHGLRNRDLRHALHGDTTDPAE